MLTLIKHVLHLLLMLMKLHRFSSTFDPERIQHPYNQPKDEEDLEPQEEGLWSGDRQLLDHRANSFL